MLLWRRISAAFIQKLILLIAVLLTLQQDATQLFVMLALAAGAALAFRTATCNGRCMRFFC